MSFSLPPSLEEDPWLGRRPSKSLCASEKLQRANLLHPAKAGFNLAKAQPAASLCKNHSSDHPSSASKQVVYQDDRSYHQQEMNQACAAADP
jgi:hypothetical protein